MPIPKRCSTGTTERAARCRGFDWTTAPFCRRAPGGTSSSTRACRAFPSRVPAFPPWVPAFASCAARQVIDICALLLDKGADAMMENDLGELPPRWVRELAPSHLRFTPSVHALHPRPPVHTTVESTDQLD